jgi:hypothetical protein
MKTVKTKTTEYRVYRRKEKILGITPVGPVDNPDDLFLVGKYGAIHYFGGDLYRVSISSSRVANRELGLALLDGDEHVLTVNRADCEKWVDILKIPRSKSSAQLRYIGGLDMF